MFSCCGQHQERCGAILTEYLPGRDGGSAQQLNPESWVAKGYPPSDRKQVDGDIPACDQLVSSQRLVEDEGFTFTRDGVEKEHQFHGFVGPVVSQEPLVGNNVELRPGDGSSEVDLFRADPEIEIKRVPSPEQAW